MVSTLIFKRSGVDMSFARINQQNIYFEDTGGDGLPLILGHGFLMDQQMFAPQVAALSPEFRVITWDERGFGQTESDGQPFTYWDSARDCLGLLDHLGIEKAVVGGMSQGGYLSLRVALLEPQRVIGLVLLNTQAGPEDPANVEGYRVMMRAWVEQGLADEQAEYIASIILADPQENARWIAKWKAQKNLQALMAAVECLLGREDITERLSEIQAPALVVHGTADTAIPMPLAESLCAGLVNSQPLVRVEGAAHAANLTHPDQVNSPLLAFLRRLQARR
jgi:pimeloyl-ACP methyl ester carboxylesterase